MSSSNKYLPAFAAVTTLFFAWGFITALIDPLVAAVKGIFSLTDLQAQFSAFAFFIAYGVMSFPAATLLARLKSVNTILLALSTMIAGCLVMLLAANIANYWLVLLGLFILASGITALQVAANPLAAALGSPEGSHFRLTLSQTFNSLGTYIGPIIGATLFLKGVEVKPGTEITEEVRATALAGIDTAYVYICGMLLALVGFFFATRKVIESAAPKTSAGASIFTMLSQALSDKWALLGGAAIFLYVGAEVSIGTQMTLFLNADTIWGQSDAAWSNPIISFLFASDGTPGISLEEAGKLTALYWGGAMVGRLFGSALLARVNAALLLGLFTAIAAGLCFYVMAVGGVSAGFAALTIGLFNSIMFPVIYTLTLERSGASTEATSGFLCTAIIGGAILPLLTGTVSGHSSYATAFIVPGVCYVLLCIFALSAKSTKVRQAAQSGSAH